MIIVKNLVKQYGPFRALDHIDIEIPDGQVVGLLGVNGAGKTTLLNILAGCLDPTEGCVAVNGHDLTADPIGVKSCLSYLPEVCPLYEELTVREFLIHICRLKGLEKAEIPDQVKAIADRVRLTDVLNIVIRNLSKGYRQRTGLAQALCGDPDILFLDEPTAGLDPLQAEEFKQILMSAHKRQTIVFSSHYLHEVEQICDRVIILHHGRIIEDRMIKDVSNLLLILKVPAGFDDIAHKLQSLDGVDKAELISQDQSGASYRLTCHSGGDAEKKIFTLLSALGTPILRLYPEKTSLEEIFLSATRSMKAGV